MNQPEASPSNNADAGRGLSKRLGLLPETDVWAIGSLDCREDVYAYSPESMEAERQRCYALGVAVEHERWVVAAQVVASQIEALPHKMRRHVTGLDALLSRIEWPNARLTVPDTAHRSNDE